jgi:tetratricopeptide (TPR) repeat protein
VRWALAGFALLCVSSGPTAAQDVVLTTHQALERYAAGDRNVIVKQAPDRLPPIWNIADDLNKLPKTSMLPSATLTESSREIAAFAVEAARTLETQNPTSVCQMINATRTRWIAAGTKTEFARRWHLAAIATMLRNDCHDAADQAVTAALQDFPDELRFRLARAVLAEQQLSETFADGRLPSARERRDAETRFKIAMALPITAPEAALRWARVNALFGDHEQAIALTAEAMASADPHVRYLAHLFRGWSLAALGKFDEADDEYAKALTIVPLAQSATLARAAAAFRQRNAARAEAIVAELTSRPQATDDPWWEYVIGDGRFVDQRIADLRKVIR